jgi:hypothetical protein
MIVILPAAGWCRSLTRRGDPIIFHPFRVVWAGRQVDRLRVWELCRASWEWSSLVARANG